MKATKLSKKIGTGWVDPIQYRNEHRPSNWPSVTLAEDLLENSAMFLLDKIGGEIWFAFIYQKSLATSTINITAKYYKGTTLVKTEDLTDVIHQTATSMESFSFYKDFKTDPYWSTYDMVLLTFQGYVTAIGSNYIRNSDTSTTLTSETGTQSWISFTYHGVNYSGISSYFNDKIAGTCSTLVEASINFTKCSIRFGGDSKSVGASANYYLPIKNDNMQYLSINAATFRQYGLSYNQSLLCAILTHINPYNTGGDATSVNSLGNKSLYGLFLRSYHLVALNELDLANIQNVTSMFSYSGISEVKLKNLQNIKYADNMFRSSRVVVAPILDMPNCVSAPTIFGGESANPCLVQYVPYLRVKSTCALNNAFQYSHIQSLDDVNLVTPWDELSSWSNMFNATPISYIDTIDLSNSTKTSIANLFQGADRLVRLDNLKYNESIVTNMSFLFYGCKSLTMAPPLNTSKNTNFTSFFYSCASLSDDYMLSLDYSSATTFRSTFKSTNITDRAVQKLIDEKINWSKVTDINGMFGSCYYIYRVDLKKMSDGLQAWDMNSSGAPFYGCSNLRHVRNCSPKVTSSSQVGSLFYNCYNLRDVNLDISYIEKYSSTITTSTSYINFYNCYSLKTVKLKGLGSSTLWSRLGKNSSTTSFTASYSMFYGCYILDKVYLYDIPASLLQTTNVQQAINGMFNNTCYRMRKISNATYNPNNENVGTIYLPTQECVDIARASTLLNTCFNFDVIPEGDTWDKFD